MKCLISAVSNKSGSWWLRLKYSDISISLEWKLYLSEVWRLKKKKGDCLTMESSFLLWRYRMSRYRLQNCRCVFFNLWVIPSLKFRLSKHTPDFTIVSQNRGDHCIKILRARYGLSLLKSVYLFRPKRAWSAFSQVLL